MTILDNKSPITLGFDNHIPSEDEKIVNSVDLRKIKEKIKNKEVNLDTEQFILVGMSMSPKETLIYKSKEEIHKFQVAIRNIVNELWGLMDADGTENEDVNTVPNYRKLSPGKKEYNEIEYSEIQERLTELISSVERVKKKLH